MTWAMVGTPALILAAMLWTAGASAQQSDYAGEQGRQIKALSAEAVSQYLSGAGMGYAKSAELNHFPGPLHALELGHRVRLGM